MSGSALDPRIWRTYHDPKTGKDYYYNVETKETTWDKPLALFSPEEREKILLKEQERMKFFREMEANIKHRYRNGAAGSERGALTPPRRAAEVCPQASPQVWMSRQNSASSQFSEPAPFNRSRSITTFDEEVTQTLSAKNSVAFEFDASKELTPPPSQLLARAQSLGIPLQAVRAIRNTRTSIDLGTMSAGEPLHSLEPPTPPRKRSNSTGTIYVDNTIAAQDVRVTIKVVCTVVRSHMLESHRIDQEARLGRAAESSDEAAARARRAAADMAKFVKKTQLYDDNWSRNNSEDDHSFKTEPDVELRNRVSGRLDLIFRDGDALGVDSSEHDLLKPVPEIEEMESFFTDVYSKSQLESSSIIICLIYCERLMNSEDGVRIKLFACLVMASKVWDDLSFWNVDFSLVCPEFTLARLNELESSMLEALSFVIKVPAGEYALYYFHARSIATNLGFKSTDINSIAPLTWDDARKLQISAEKYIQFVKKGSASTDDSGLSLRPRGKTLQSLDDYRTSPSRRASLGIDEIVSPTHLQADGTLGSPQRRNSLRFMNSQNSLRMIDSAATLVMTDSQNSFGFTFTDSPKREVINMQDPDAVFLP